ncbi:MAG: flavin reductase family protein [Beutenbergiaceae bacterium]
MSADLRQAMSRAVSGVAVVTAREGRHDLAVTVTSFLTVSLDPPMVGFLVHRDARIRDQVGTGRSWAANILGSQGRAAAQWLGEPGRPILDQLTQIPHRLGEASGAALLEVATVWIQARTVHVAQAGSHDFIAAEVLDCTINADNNGAILHGYGQLHVWQS